MPKTPLEGTRDVNKSELIEHIAKQADISKAAASRSLEAVIGAVKTTLKKGGNVTITGFSTANDKLTFNDTGAGTLLTEAQFKVLLGVSIAENPFANETTISMDPDGVNTGSVKLVGIVDAALNQIVVETTP